MNLTKDAYEYLLNFADDKDIINMLSVNKKFADDDFFKRLILRKYPYLASFKREDETWRKFFVKMVYYLSLLKENHQIPYIPAKNYNPEEFYKQYGKSVLAIYFATEIAVNEGGNYELVQQMLNRIKTIAPKIKINYIASLNDLLDQATESGDLDTIKLLLKNGANDFERILINGAVFGHLNIVKYAIENRDKIDKSYIEDSIIIAKDKQNKEIEDYLRIFL